MYQSVTRQEFSDESEFGNYEFVVSKTSPSPGIWSSWSRRRFRVRECASHGIVCESESGSLVSTKTGTGLKGWNWLSKILVWIVKNWIQSWGRNTWNAGFANNLIYQNVGGLSPYQNKKHFTMFFKPMNKATRSAMGSYGVSFITHVCFLPQGVQLLFIFI